MAVAYVQSVTGTGSTDDIDVVLTGVTNGNLCVGMHTAEQGAERTYEWSDDQANSWTEVDEQGGVIPAGIDYAANVTGNGDGDVTFTNSFTTTINGKSRAVAVIEFSGADTTTPLDVNDTDTNSSSTTHNCATSGNIDTVADVAVVACATCSANHGGCTPATGFTELYDGTLGYMQYMVSASALTNERGAFTSTNTRNSTGLIASFKGAVAGGGGGPKSPLRGPFAGPFGGPI